MSIPPRWTVPLCLAALLLACDLGVSTFLAPPWVQAAGGSGSLPGVSADEGLPAPLGIRLADWTLPRSDNGRPWSLARDGRDARAVAVLFLCTQCPVNNLYLPTLAALHEE